MKNNWTDEDLRAAYKAGVKSGYCNCYETLKQMYGYDSFDEWLKMYKDKQKAIDKFNQL